VKYQVSCPYKATGEVIFQDALIFYIFLKELEDEKF
jgi:hypothetical protein